MKLKISMFVGILLTAAFIFIACSKQHELLIPKNENPLIQALLDSKSFANHKSYIESKGTIAYSKIKEISVPLGNNETATGFVIPVQRGSNLVGYVEIIDLKNTKLLPNKDTYGMNFVDLNDFSMTTKSGKVQMIDLNYDNFLHTNVIVENNKIISWKSVGLSKDLLLKYKDLKKGQVEEFNKEIGTNSTDLKTKVVKAAIYTLCDSDGNSNISFGECYKCAQDAIDSNGTSSFICDFPGIGWFSCWGTSSAACLYISAKY
ncbi:MAG: hypothetical protein IM584_04230 [Chitinophagaceae bacterium]|nr:hypothetical protein [Chitinophagaceae bacterium]MCA6453800.1 hypothetical protein [Chitinophagaceae bacterium]MCA6455323.1 hypothetical protein [Chitinophagaceae bacterium]MCA6460132.1 hypothetical protein [Chitinophagaceae bacterium]MCA6464044.1 hypothetical protein [Chitinophagaceae bacterium]